MMLNFSKFSTDGMAVPCSQREIRLVLFMLSIVATCFWLKPMYRLCLRNLLGMYEERFAIHTQYQVPLFEKGGIICHKRQMK